MAILTVFTFSCDKDDLELETVEESAQMKSEDIQRKGPVEPITDACINRQVSSYTLENVGGTSAKFKVKARLKGNSPKGCISTVRNSEIGIAYSTSPIIVVAAPPILGGGQMVSSPGVQYAYYSTDHDLTTGISYPSLDKDVTVRGLNPLQKYYFKAFYKESTKDDNISGDYRFNSVQRTATTTEAACIPVSVITSSKPYYNTDCDKIEFYDLGWFFDNDPNCEIDINTVEVGIAYTDFGTFIEGLAQKVKWETSEVNVNTNGVQTAFVFQNKFIEDLNEGTSYLYRIYYEYDNGNEVFYSDDYTFTPECPVANNPIACSPEDVENIGNDTYESYDNSNQSDNEWEIGDTWALLITDFIDYTYFDVEEFNPQTGQYEVVCYAPSEDNSRMGIQYSTSSSFSNPKYQDFKGEEAYFGDNTFTLALTRLSPNTTYYTRYYYKAVGGDFEFSNQVYNFNTASGSSQIIPEVLTSNFVYNSSAGCDSGNFRKTVVGNVDLNGFTLTLNNSHKIVFYGGVDNGTITSLDYCSSTIDLDEDSSTSNNLIIGGEVNTDLSVDFMYN